MAGVDAFGTVWSMDPAGGTTYVAVGEVTEIGVLDIKVDTIDVSSHDSTGQWREFIGGMKDGGELKMTVNYDPALHGTIFSNLGVDGVTHEIVLTDAGAAVITFTGILTGMSLMAPMDDKLSSEVSIKVTGAPVINP